MSGAIPPPRSRHTMIGPLVEQYPLLVVVQGFNGESPYRDVWLLDVDKGTWVEVSIYTCSLLTIYTIILSALIWWKHIHCKK